MYHFDGRLARTVPLLFLRPGVLARDYMEGRIARHVPPFRTFLVALLLFILAAEHAIHGMQHKAELAAHRHAEAMQTPQGRADEAARIRALATTARDAALKASAESRDEALADGDEPRAKVLAKHEASKTFIAAQYARALSSADQIEHDPEAAKKALEASENPGASAAERMRGLTEDAEAAGVKAEVHMVSEKYDEAWLKAQLAKALESPEFYFMTMFGWAHRLAVLLLPIIGLGLTLVYLDRRQLFIQDHLMVATNLLSFAFLTNALGLILPGWAASVWFPLLAIWTPINMFQTLRGGYGSSIPGAMFKTLVVGLTSATAFGVLLVGLMFFSLTQI